MIVDLIIKYKELDPVLQREDTEKTKHRIVLYPWKRVSIL